MPGYPQPALFLTLPATCLELHIKALQAAPPLSPHHARPQAAQGRHSGLQPHRTQGRPQRCVGVPVPGVKVGAHSATEQHLPGSRNTSGWAFGTLVGELTEGRSAERASSPWLQPPARVQYFVRSACTHRVLWDDGQLRAQRIQPDLCHVLPCQQHPARRHLKGLQGDPGSRPGQQDGAIHDLTDGVLAPCPRWQTEEMSAL